MSNDLESWMPIKGYEGYYMVSDRGRVMNVRNGRVLSPHESAHGYLQVGLGYVGDKKDSAGHRAKAFYLHRLVLEAFKPILAHDLEVNHIDGNKANNTLANLEWCASSENKKHAYATGLATPHNKTSEEVVKEIRKSYVPFSRGQCSAKEISKRLGVSRDLIQKYGSNLGPKGIKETINGRPLTELAREIGISRSTLVYRLKHGFSEEELLKPAFTRNRWSKR